MLTVVPAEGVILERILAMTAPVRHEGLGRQAFATLDAAQTKTAWALRHQRRFALVDGADLLASAQRFAFNGILDHKPVSICGIGAVVTAPAHRGGDHARWLVGRLADEAARDGMDLALLFATPDSWSDVPEGFEPIPATEVEVTVAEPHRRGAPMTLVRGGEDRDLPAIVAMGGIRADRFRFHLHRDADLVKHAITKKRLLAGLGSAGDRQLQFVIAEEGITAAAYVVISIVGRTWTIEECGDRDPSGARVGAILQALIASEPAERRPVIRGWLPPGFMPPQVTILSARVAAEVMMMRALRSTVGRRPLSTDDVLYWRSDLF
jgi:GNAT superfamily N-acetyltransferase